MKKEEYIDRFDKASNFCRDFTLQFIEEHLPEKINFNIEWHSPKDAEGKRKFLGGRLVSEGDLKQIEYAKARKMLWIDGKIPQWINMNIDDYDEEYTTITIRCCGRLTNQEECLYHESEGNPPFHILGPALPENWESIEKSGKIKLKKAEPTNG